MEARNCQSTNPRLNRAQPSRVPFKQRLYPEPLRPSRVCRRDKRPSRGTPSDLTGSRHLTTLSRPGQESLHDATGQHERATSFDVCALRGRDGDALTAPGGSSCLTPACAPACWPAAEQGHQLHNRSDSHGAVTWRVGGVNRDAADTTHSSDRGVDLLWSPDLPARTHDPPVTGLMSDGSVSGFSP